MVDWTPYVDAWTTRLRDGSDPLYARVAELLRQQGVDVESVVVASFSPEGNTAASGVVVTPDRHVFEFEVTYPAKAYSQAELRAWRDCTGSYTTRGFRDRVAAGLVLLQRTTTGKPVEVAS